MRRAWAILLVVPAFGFTDCQYFNTVTVPASDTTPPLIATRLWVDGQEAIRFGTIEQVVDADTSFLVVPSVYDSGGAKSLTLQQIVRVRCHDYDADPEETQATDIFFFDRFDSQSGWPGSSVSNGLYLIGDVTDLGSFDWYCYDGFDLTEIRYEWTTTGQDFAGNVVSELGSFVYVP